MHSRPSPGLSGRLDSASPVDARCPSQTVVAVSRVSHFPEPDGNGAAGMVASLPDATRERPDQWTSRQYSCFSSQARNVSRVRNSSTQTPRA